MSPVLPIALAFAALALVQIGLAWRSMVAAAATVVLVAGVIFVAKPHILADVALALCWATVLASAGTAILSRQPGSGAALALASATGIATGLVAASAGSVVPLLEASPAGLLLALATVRRWQGLRLLTQIVAAWMLAVALLSATIPLVATPGYQSDHRE